MDTKNSEFYNASDYTWRTNGENFIIRKTIKDADGNIIHSFSTLDICLIDLVFSFKKLKWLWGTLIAIILSISFGN